MLYHVCHQIFLLENFINCNLEVNRTYVIQSIIIIIFLRLLYVCRLEWFYSKDDGYFPPEKCCFFHKDTIFTLLFIDYFSCNLLEWVVHVLALCIRPNLLELYMSSLFVSDQIFHSPAQRTHNWFCISTLR